MSCYCKPKVTYIPPVETCEGKCLRLATLRIGCDDGPTCGETVSVDLEEYNDTSQGVNVKYKLTKLTYAGFTSVTLTEQGLLVFTTDDEITADVEEEISYKVYEDGGLLSATGYVYICSEDKCKGVTCPEGELCNKCTALCEEVTDIQISSNVAPDLVIS